MRSKATSPTSPSEAGFSLVELLVTVLIASVALAAAVSYYAYEAKQMRQSSLRIEAQQALRASLDAMARDIRLAGACLPTVGPFMALDGSAGATDSITVRAGVVQGVASCVQGGATTAINAGDTTINVTQIVGFAPGQLILVAPDVGGEIVNGVSAVSGPNATGGGTITLSTGVVNSYVVGTGIYALDERVYWIDTTNPALPTLSLSVNRGPTEAFAAGMIGLQFQYVLNQNCPTCTVINANGAKTGSPPVNNDAVWRLVNDVIITATVQTIGASPQEASEVTLVETTHAKPRNLLQPGA
ncbi:MAG TPA: prepilin-type N-terminal cleavage/methylation domain-containing protein [Candidatus Binatia bacterium]|nr:prepilin-type N-terminal cleavage/methylation domain-containing protein [Candidatus Binatia bacterium]